MRLATIPMKYNKIDVVNCYEVCEFPVHELSLATVKARNKKNVNSYNRMVCTFDIEASTIDNGVDTPYGFMYHWQACIGGIVVYGRRWEEWQLLLDKICKYCNINFGNRLVFYVHNLSYEYQFIRNFIGEHDVFASKKRKPMHVTTENGLEFRCSYFLTNMSLAKACENELGCEHIKADGDLDYHIVRTADTILNDTEFGYCIADVVCLYDMIVNRLKNENDTLESIPLTSTGYVRRECRKASRNEPRSREQFLKQKLLPEVYDLLEEAGRGGNTHANRYLAGRIWDNVTSYDVVSSYPSQIMLQYAPASAFWCYGQMDDTAEFQSLLEEYCCLFRVAFTNIQVHSDVAMPYIPISKLLDNIPPINADNGRVLSANYIAMTVTEIDFNIIKEQYSWESIHIGYVYIAKRGDFPSFMRKQVMNYYEQKTVLKDKIKQADTKAEKENYQYLYAKSKNRLNSIFGMSYMKIKRPMVTINGNGEWVESFESTEDAIERYYNSRNNFLNYAHGVYITAHARAWLEKLIQATGNERTIYCDTDSSKAIDVDQSKIDMLNEDIIKLCEEKEAYIDCNGTRYYLGLYERENDIPYDGFITLGAKKYAYTDSDGLHVTISGVNKKLGAKELGSIDNFVSGFVFRDAGGQELYYNDEESVYQITIDGCTFTTSSNIGMIDSTYTIGITTEYMELIGLNILDITA